METRLFYYLNMIIVSLGQKRFPLCWYLFFPDHQVIYVKDVIIWNIHFLYLNKNKLRCSFLWFRWQKVSDPGSILELIKQVYADPSTKVDKVFSRIVETTQHPAAAASLASIMFAPRAQLSFQEALSRYWRNQTISHQSESANYLMPKNCSKLVYTGTRYFISNFFFWK